MVNASSVSKILLKSIINSEQIDQETLEFLEDWKESSQNDIEALTLYVLAQLYQKNYRKAQSQLPRLRKLRQNDVFVELVLARTLQGLGLHEEALISFEHLKSRIPHLPVMWYLVFASHLVVGEEQNASDILENRALPHNPRSPVLLTMYERIRKTDSAFSSDKRKMDYESMTREEARLLLGITEFYNNDLDNAGPNFAHASEDHKLSYYASLGLSTLHVKMGMRYQQQSDFESSLYEYGRAERYHPANPLVPILKSTSRLLMGQEIDAEYLLKSLDLVNSDEAKSYCMLASAYFMAKYDKKKALELIDNGLDIAPKHSRISKLVYSTVNRILDSGFDANLYNKIRKIIDRLKEFPGDGSLSMDDLYDLGNHQGRKDPLGI